MVKSRWREKQLSNDERGVVTVVIECVYSIISLQDEVDS